MVLIGDASVVQLGLRMKYGVLCRLQYCVEAADDRHGQDDIAILAPHVDIAEHVVRYTPNEATDVEGGHSQVSLKTTSGGRFHPSRSDSR